MSEIKHDHKGQRAFSERVEDYVSGGLHPVHMGDSFHDGQYEIILKLGIGGYSTVWLAKDTKNNINVCIKILRADASDHELRIMQRLKTTKVDHPGCQYVVRLLDHFYHTGPNGVHLCLVLERLGPALRSLVVWQENYMNDSEQNFIDLSLSRSISRQLLLAVDFIHSCGVVHGDIHTGNVLFRISAPQQEFVDSVVPKEGPDYSPLTWERNEPPEGTFPKYLMDPARYSNKLIEGADKIALVDFSNAFLVSEPPPKMTETIKNHLSPEHLFGRPMTKAIDIWSLACTTHEIVTTMDLFYLGFSEARSLISDIHLAVGESCAHWLLTAMRIAITEREWKDWPKFEDWGNDFMPLEEAVIIDYFPEDEENPASHEKEVEQLNIFSRYLRKMLVPDATKRPTAEQLMCEEWVQEQ